MPTIRIEDDVFEALKKLAEPFVDTPNTVIRRLLQQHGDGAAGRKLSSLAAGETDVSERPKRSRKGELTPQSAYESFLLHVLSSQFKGRASKVDATGAVIELMNSRQLLKEADFATVMNGETKAQNTVAWGRNALKDRGLIASTSPKGIWELTAKGMTAARKVTLP